MTANIVLATSILWALCGASPSLGQDYSLDIDVQGPWILYQDNSFQVNNVTTPVLVLMAPDVTHSHIGEYNHQPAGFSAGDGTPLIPGTIYCVQFVDSDSSTCSPKHVAAPSSGIAAQNMLSVRAPQNWDWYGASAADRAGRTYVILPLPDDYINDGVWWIKTGASYDAHSSNYTPYLVSLGIYLHYKSIGATRVQLLGCGSPTAHDASTCTTNIYSLLNRGSIRIDMKTPINNDACDFHVRYAYPRMLKMLDNTPLYSAGSTNINAGKAFVSPAKAFQENGGIYDGDNGTVVECADDDPQTKYPELQAMAAKPIAESAAAVQSNSTDADLALDAAKEQSLLLHKGAILERLSNILSAIAKLHGSGKACDRGAVDPYFGCSFKDISDMLSATSGAPTYSQTERLNEVLKDALAADTTPPRKPREQATAIDQVMSLEADMVDRLATKNGNDCRAPIMSATSE